MIAGQQPRREETYTELFDVLTDETRRQIIRIVRTRSEPLTERQLLDRLTAANLDSASTSETSQKSRFIRLYHVHLPKLTEAGIIEWDRSTRTVTPTDYPVSEIDRLEQTISSNDWDSIASALADSCRRQALSIIESEPDRITCKELTNELPKREGSEQGPDGHESLNVQLYHHHLPKLEAAGLIEFDPDESMIAYRGPATLSNLLPEARKRFHPAANE